MTSEASIKQSVPRPLLKTTFDCFLPPGQSALRKPQVALPFQATPTANLEWASAFLDYAGQLMKTREQKYEELAAKYNTDNDHLKKDNDHLKNDNDHLKKDNDHLKKDNDHLKKDNAKLNHMIEHLHADVAREQTAHKKLQEAFDHFRSESKAEKARLTKDLDAARRKFNEGRSHDAKDHKIIEDLHRALDEGNEANALLQDKLDAKIKELLQTQQELQVAKDAHKIAENSIVQLNGEIEHLKKDLADRDSTIRKYESDMTQLRDANASLVSENQQLSTAIAQLREANALLVSEKNQLSKDLASKTAALQSAQEELTAAQNVVVAQKKTLSEQDHKIKTLQIQLKCKSQDFEDFKNRSEEREEKLQQENNKLNKHDKEDHAIISKANLDKELHDLDDQNANKPLIEELLALKAQLDAANKEAADAKQRASDADAQRKSAEAAAAKAALEHDQAHKALLPHDVKLANPIALVGSLKGAPRDVDDETFYINCSFPVMLFGTASNRIYISVNGLLTLDHASTEYKYQKLPYRGGIFSRGLPSHVLAPFWADLYIYKNTPQGVYYEETGSEPNRKLEVEWYVSRYHSPEQYYHFSLVIEESKPNLATFKYFKAMDKGGKCTIGIQGPKTYKMFSYNEEKALPGTQVTFDTDKNTFTASTFDISASAKKPAVNGNVVRDVKPANEVSATVSQVVGV